MVVKARPEFTPWVQQHNPENIGYNLAQAHSFRSLTLSLAGSIAGVLGLHNLAGFAFFAVSVVFCNLVLVLVKAEGDLDKYFLLANLPPVTNAGERLLPSKAAQLRSPPTSMQRNVQLAKWVILQGLQENALGYILWWTFCI